MKDAVIIKCTCEHAFQDRRYGKGFRVGNKVGKNKGSGYRCTVCGSIRKVRYKRKNLMYD